MSPELDKLLCERYPKIFADRHRSISESCMGWGFSCGDGWFDVIDVLCERLQFEVEHNNAPQPVAVQVKEKLGRLRFYAQPTSEAQSGMIEMAQALSARICEVCAQPGQVLVCGAVMTRCPAHTPVGAVTEVEFIERLGVPGIAP
jgi:hypothetical protein